MLQDLGDHCSVCWYYIDTVRKHETARNTSLAAPGALAHRLQRRTACFIQNGRQGPEIGQTLSYWTLRSTFAK